MAAEPQEVPQHAGQVVRRNIAVDPVIREGGCLSARAAV